MAGALQLRDVYLVAYNATQALGWAWCLWTVAASYAVNGGNHVNVFNAAGGTARVFQLLSGLEVIHTLLGIVRSSPAMALLQWAGRSNILFLVLSHIPDVQASPASSLLLAVWGCIRVVRYPWYALSSLDVCPHALTWLRYTAFIPLYPIGVACEMWLLWSALPVLAARDMYSWHLPNRLNFAFSYHTFSKVGLVVYLPVWWQLYASLLKQRAKKLGTSHGKTD
ncbi:tyrosine phosphatase-like protein [Haematococcus lacustris]